MGDKITVIGSNVSKEMVGVGGSCEQFGNGMDGQMSSLNDVQEEIGIGVGNIAQASESKLTANEERNNKKEKVPTSMYDELNKIMQVLTQSRDEPKMVWSQLIEN